MPYGLQISGKREWLARCFRWSGVSTLLSQLPARDMLVILNYHRIGNPDEDLFDPGVFSATGKEFDEQVSYLKRHVSLVTLDEALAFVDGTAKAETPRCRALITFDDGYLDNYEIAYPILKAHGVQGVFFLPTSMVGSNHVPWWDQIAYIAKTAQLHRFTLRYPAELAVDIDRDGIDNSLRAILSLYKMPENTDSPRFMRELAEQAEGENPPGTERRFLDWVEAREMIAGGMAIGSHTHSHHILSQLEPQQQFEELVQSRAILKEQLGNEVDVLAYPVGARSCFTMDTQKAARDAGYRAAFSFYGGTNFQGKTSAYDVQRVAVDDQSYPRFQVQTTICRATGKFWP
jgi:peptidoglycan/xylan/chitin deacetylase (PgdA/CDA1 family)